MARLKAGATGWQMARLKAGTGSQMDRLKAGTTGW
jgi:hypothetical protein